jgi:microcystin-dependent protein
MPEAFLGEIKMFAGNYPPRDWAFCNGQLLEIKNHNALFAILGTNYGGDGRVTFGLPDLRGRVPIHAGAGSQGPGLSPYQRGERGGREIHTLNNANMPPANLEGNNIYNAAGNQKRIDGNTQSLAIAGKDDGRTTSFAGSSFSTNPPNAKIPNIGSVGGQGRPISNMQPYLGVNFIICLEGVFPPRS